MVQWFQLVLQWDPHKRGKIVDKFGTSHLAVFTMLQDALLNKVCIKATYFILISFLLFNLYFLCIDTVRFLSAILQN